MASKNVTESVQSLGALLRLPYQALLDYTYGQLAAGDFVDIRPAHSSVFRHILPEGSRVTDLAARAQLTKQSMAYLVSDLEEHGYVALESDPEDGRAKLVKLTRRGVEFQQAAIRRGREFEARLAEVIGTEEMKQLRISLERIVEHIQDAE